MSKWSWGTIAVLAVAFVLGAGYCAQRWVNNAAMASAMERDDVVAITSLLDGWPCPVNAYYRGPDVGKMACGGVGRSSRHDHDELTPLIWAMTNKNEAVLRKCLDKGANVRFRSYFQATPLHFAVCMGTADMIEALIDHGADVRAAMVDGRMPLHCAESPEAVFILLKHGADVNARDKHGQPPLIVLATMKASVTAALLDAGADVNAKDSKGWTPLHAAVEGGRRELIELLLTHGADANARAINGITPLGLARAMKKANGPSPTDPLDAVIDLLLKSDAKE